MAAHLDLNADVGEGFPHDRALLRFLSSANIACGFHAGDARSMRELCRWCRECGVAVGAQVSYRDREGFGRRSLDVGYDDLRADITEQLEALSRAAEQESGKVAYVKPHGALYNRVVSDEEQAAAVVDAVVGWGLPVLGLPGSRLLAAAEEAGLRPVREFFADRGYAADGTLVPRTSLGALVTDRELVAEKVAMLLETGRVQAVDGSTFPLEADSICVHGDTPDALGLAQTVAAVLDQHGVETRAPW
jgi:UPF0271 protein